MSRLIESIQLNYGRFHRLQYHQARIDNSIQQLFNVKSNINLNEHLQALQYPKTELVKCRIVYERKIEKVEFIPYTPTPIKTLKVVHDNEIDYQFKFEDRTRIQTLLKQRQFCDDVLIIKNGFVTDTSYCNILFYDGHQWITPSTPLLKGTMRQMLMDAAEIREEVITIQDIPSFKRFRLINSMLGFDGPEIEVSRIVF
jgi:4-amino-4-deoxychorismate lyase